MCVPMCFIYRNMCAVHFILIIFGFVYPQCIPGSGTVGPNH